MAHVGLKEILLESVRKTYAVGAFDSMNYLMTEAILEAAEEKNTPVILMFPGDVVMRPGAEKFFRCTRMLVDQAPVPVTIHLDHGTNFEVCMKAIKYGFGGVMFDGSNLPIEENISITKKVVDAAHAAGVAVEAEVGHVGGLEAETAVGTVDKTMYTKTEDAIRFVEETNVDALAVAIGTVHGVFAMEPHLDLKRLTDIRRNVDVPLVLHGGSGLSDTDFRNVVQAGINKINFFTGMSFAGVEGTGAILDKYSKENKSLHVFDMLDACKNSMKKVVEHQIEVFGTLPLKN